MSVKSDQLINVMNFIKLIKLDLTRSINRFLDPTQNMTWVSSSWVRPSRPMGDVYFLIDMFEPKREYQRTKLKPSESTKNLYKAKFKDLEV